MADLGRYWIPEAPLGSLGDVPVERESVLGQRITSTVGAPVRLYVWGASSRKPYLRPGYDASLDDTKQVERALGAGRIRKRREAAAARNVKRAKERRERAQRESQRRALVRGEVFERWQQQMKAITPAGETSEAESAVVASAVMRGGDLDDLLERMGS